MGVFDFVRDVGAKIGIGKSTDEIKAETAAEAAQESAQRGLKQRAKAAAKAQKERVEEAAKSVARSKKTEELKQAAANRKFAAYKKSIELERYVSDLGFDAKGIDIRFQGGTAYIEGSVPDQETREKIILAVGNAEGVGQVHEEIEVDKPADQAVFHTVQSGDTLWAVAEKVYGDGNRYNDIFEANKPMLADPDLIYPGQVLRCPK